MAITLDSASSHAANASFLSWAHVCAGGAKILVVGIGYRADATFTSVTYNGIALTLLRTDSCGATSVHVKTSLCYLLDPPPGSFNVIATVSASGGLVGGAHSYFGVSGLLAQAGASADDSSPSVTVLSGIGEVVVDVIHARNQAGSPAVLTVGAGQTEHWNRSDTGQARGAGSHENGAAAASVAMSWTYTNPSTPHWSMSAMSLVAVVAAQPAEYAVRARSPRTLKLSETFKSWRKMTWTRRAVEGGTFTLVVDKDQLEDDAHVGLDQVIEVRRDGAYEFAGVIARREYDSETRRWTLSGPDLKGWWLTGRAINPGVSEFDTQTGVAAETAMLYYLNAHLVAPADDDRAIANEIAVDFIMPGDSARGGDVDYNARFKPLAEALADLAYAGDLTHEIVIDSNDNYAYIIRSRLDKTAGTGSSPVVFSVEGLNNVAGSIYVEDSLRLSNFLYVLGDGQGAARIVREVQDADHISGHFRREGVLDARDADTNAKLDQAGNVAIAQAMLDARAARMEPISVGPTLYRTHFDVGDDVTVSFRDIGETVDRRIDEIAVTLDASVGETIKVALGRRPQTLERLLADLQRRSQVGALV